MVVEHPPSLRRAQEEVRGLGHGHADVTVAGGGDVLRAAHHADVAQHLDVDAGGDDADPTRPGEDLLERLPHLLPPHEKVPPRMDAAHPRFLQPHALHGREVELFDRAVERAVRLTKRFARIADGLSCHLFILAVSPPHGRRGTRSWARGCYFRQWPLGEPPPSSSSPRRRWPPAGTPRRRTAPSVRALPAASPTLTSRVMP